MRKSSGRQTRFRTLAGLLLAALGSPALAAEPAISDALLNDTLDLGAEIEIRADGDLNGDGRLDTAYISRGDDRILNVLIRRDGPGQQRYEPAGALKLGKNTLAPATLSISRGVLVFHDKVGKDAKLASTYRYRITPARMRMRLIGLDSTLETDVVDYDGFEISWNLVTGDIVTRILRAQGSARPLRYARMFEQRAKRLSPQILMEDTPDPEFVMIDIRKK